MSNDDEPSSADLAAPCPEGRLERPRSAFALILAKLGRRDRTEKELSAALGRKGFSEEAASAALRRARREGLVNDERLAGAIARINARSGKRGPLRVVATLRQKGIAAETARAVTKDAFAGSDEGERNLIRFATGLLRRAKGDTLRDKRVRVVRSLMGRGFGLSEAKRALRLAENAVMVENRGDDADE
ncbi:MAG: regulatory protein RecX [Vicinamibacteria bacterium]